MSPAVAGRSPDGRTATVTTTNASAAITGAAGTFHEEDVGRSISGTGIPAGATISAVTSPTQATLSANATASGSPVATLGAAPGSAYGFTGWSPESDAESETYSVAANNAGTAPPDRLTDTTTGVAQRWRS